MDESRKPLVARAILKASKDDSSKKMSFKDEGIRESAEQMIQALKDMPYNPCYDDEAGSNMEKRDDENDELFELRKKSRLLEREMDAKKREAYVDAFIEGLCSFLEIKYGLEPEDKDEY